MDTDVSENAVVVYRTYIANAPSEQSGCTLMWHGLKREWEGEEFLLKIQDFFPLDEIDFVYLPLNFWHRKEELTKSRVKNKGYAFVHLNDAKKEAEFSDKVATLSQQLKRDMHTIRASAQGVTEQLRQTIQAPKGSQVAKGVVHLRIKDELKPVSRYDLWRLQYILKDSA